MMFEGNIITLVLAKEASMVAAGQVINVVIERGPCLFYQL
jgi:flagella basal body P-ring formation protein FlgA